MRFIIVFLRLIALFLGIIGAFTCVILIGFLIIALAQDLTEFSDKLEYKYIKNY